MDSSVIKNSLIFKGLTENEVEHCLNYLQAQEKRYKKGSAILHAGDMTDRMGLVLSGSVTIESNDLWGNCIILSHVGQGQFFAETYALLNGEVLLVDVMANEDCRILFLTVNHIYGAISDEPWLLNITRNLLRISTRKNLMLTGRSFHTSPKSIRARILSYLNSVSLQKHSAEFDIPFDRQQMADYLEVERTGLSKEIGRMQREGLIECRKNHFRLIS